MIGRFATDSAAAAFSWPLVRRLSSMVAQWDATVGRYAPNDLNVVIGCLTVDTVERHQQPVWVAICATVNGVLPTPLRLGEEQGRLATAA